MNSMFVSTLLLCSTFGGGLPFGLPPADEDPVMSAVAPEECLAYISWAGSDEVDPKSKNEFEKLLAEPEVQFLLKDLERISEDVLELLEEEEGPREATWARLGVNWTHRLLSRPAAGFISDVAIGPGGPPSVKGGLVVTVGKEGDELVKMWDEIRAGAPEDAVKVIKIDDVLAYRVVFERDAPPVTFAIKDEYLYVGLGEGSIEEMFERSGGKAPTWLTKLKKDLPVDRRSIVTYLNAGQVVDTVSKLLLGGPEGKVILDAVGVGNMKSLASVSGLDDSGFVTRGLMGLDGDPKGLLAAAIGKPLTAKDLHHIPADSTLAVAARFDAAKFFDESMGTLAKFDPGIAEEIREEMGELEEEIGFGIRRDLLAGLGDSIYLYHSPGEGGLLAGAAMVVSVRDHAKIDGILQKYMKMAKAVEAIGGDFAFGPRLGTQKVGDNEIHYVKFIDHDVPFSPAWCLSDDVLIFGLYPQTVKAYLSRGDDYQSIATVPEVVKAIENSKPIKVVYQNTPYLFDWVYPFAQIGLQMATGEIREEGIDIDATLLPSGSAIKKHLRPDVITVAQTKAGLEFTNHQSFPGSNMPVLLPALLVIGISADGELDHVADEVFGILSPSRAKRIASTNNLKWLAIAMHNYADTYRSFPPAYTTSDAGKPLLSWRVALLPYLDDGFELHKKFRLDEPWDSEHNKKLIPLMPKSLRAPGSRLKPGMTNYVTPRGEKTVFPGKEKIEFRHILDGTSNTILLLEVSDDKAVIWTKPDDYNVDPMNPIKGVVGLRKGGFLAAFSDGSVRFFSNKIDKETLQYLFQRDDGQPIDERKLDPEARDRGRVRFDEVPAKVIEIEPEPPIEDDAKEETKEAVPK